jgi:hypothetical protein
VTEASAGNTEKLNLFDILKMTHPSACLRVLFLDLVALFSAAGSRRRRGSLLLV